MLIIFQLKLQTNKMKSATKEQIKAINATLAKKGLMEEKASIIMQSTNGRTGHSSELYLEEAKALLKSLLTTGQTPRQGSKNKMIGKIFAMAHEIGWVGQKTSVNDKGQMFTANDYSKVYAWIKKYGYLHKDIKQYEFNEIPKLLTQFEQGPYNHFLSK
jgi:hypothetical protein